MIRALIKRMYDEAGTYCEIAGLSTDTKPTDVVTGSKFYEVDTGFGYEYDEVGETWYNTTVTDATMADAVAAWLEAHPEATTTVQDGAITLAKVNSDAVATTAETQTYLNIT